MKLLWDLPSGFIKHGWLENPRAEWRFFHRKITFLNIQQTVFDFQRVHVKLDVNPLGSRNSDLEVFEDYEDT